MLRSPHRGLTRSRYCAIILTMKHFSILILAIILPIAAVQADKAKSDAAFEKGKAYYQGGHYKQARAQFLEAMKENPQNTRAQQYLRHVQAAAKHGVKPANLKAKLDSITVREVKFEEVAVADALAFVRAKVVESTGGQLRPNFILKESTKSKVTLDLGGLPASEVLRYIAELSGLQVTYDPHAAVFSKKTSAPTTSAPSPRKTKR